MSVFNHYRQYHIQILFGLLLILIVGRLLQMQVFDKSYANQAELIGKVKKIVYPERGLVFDRKGKSILENQPVFDLMVTPSELRKNRCDTFAICRVLNIDTAMFNARLVKIRFKLGNNRPSPFESLLNLNQQAQFNEIINDIGPAFYLQERSTRSYPFDAAGNVLGYLGELDSAALKNKKYAGYSLGDYAGQDGLEKSYEKVLMGQRGIEYWKRDNKNRFTEKFENGKYDTAAEAGSNLHSSIDIKLQMLGEKLLSNKIGSVVAIDPRTGGVLAMVSSPTYKPSYLSGTDRSKHFYELMYQDARTPLFNRALKGTYSPGSTFKTLQAIIGMAEGVSTPETGFPCSGRYRVCGGRGVGCHGGGHAPNLRMATAVSCNSYFCNIFKKILDQEKYGSVQKGLSVWDQYLYDMKIGVKTGVDLPGESAGNIPTPQSLKKDLKSENWNSCSIISCGIGQGQVDATVLQMANSIAIIANKGFFYTPHLIDSIDGGDKYKVLDSFKIKRQAVVLPDSSFEAIHSGMDAVVNSGSGTARKEKIPGIVMCGKTGTVENYYRGKKQANHSFFAAFAPRDTPRIAIACIIENGGYGAAVAAPVCGLMVEQYLKDTIDSKGRRARISQIENKNLIPKRIYTEFKRQDSARHSKDTAYLIEKGYIKLVVEDTMSLEDRVEKELNEKAKIEEMKNIADGKGESNEPTSSGKEIKNSDAILPKEKKGIDSIKNKNK